MSNVTPSSVPAGWYPDPAGTPRQRWWDGGAWTEHYNETPVAAAQPGVPQPYAGGQQPYSYAAAGETLKAPAGIPVYNIWIWLVVGLPILTTIISYATTDWSSLATTTAGPTNGSLIVGALGWVVYGLGVFFAYRDYKTLLGLGVPRPFHWAWAFLSVVYVIGRSVVVRRRTGHGILPMWISIAYIALSIIFSIVMVVIITAATIGSLPGR